jgi:thiol-disulfide isomerase/thioredoxin
MNKKLLLENWVEKKQNIMLFFSSKGCGVCKEVKPLIEQFAKLKTKFIYYNIVEGEDDASNLEKFCGIEFYPTLLILEGTEIKKYVGVKQIKNIILKED